MNRIVWFIFFLVLFTSHAQTPTWSGDVAKLIYANCTSCHRSGGIAPFALETYEEVSNMAGWLQQAMEEKRMPPWTPDEEYKHFVHERVMDPSEITTFQQWVAAGMPSGNLNIAPPLPVFADGSQLGVPDLSLSIPSYTVATASDVYRNFELFVGNSSATNATAIEVVPGNTAIVHHVLVFQDSTSNPINADGAGGTGSDASQLLYSYVPGSSPYVTPVGTGFRLAPNTRIILQIHYAPGSNGLTDATTVNFKTDNSALRKIYVNPILNHGTLNDGPLVIPANQVKTFNSEYVTPIKSTVLYVFPHMHLLGKSVKVWSNAPSTNDTTRFAWVPQWDFHWQDNFIFPNSVILPLGSSIKAQAVYDNTTSNPDNPSSPPVLVTAGESTTDEMFLVFFAYMPFAPGDQYLIIDKRIFPKGATTFCAGRSVRLEAIQGVGYAYQWYLNGVMLSGETAYFLDADASGEYTVSILLGPNSVLSDPVAVVVTDGPIAQIQSPASTDIPVGGSILLSAVAASGVQYQWYLNGNPISGANSDTYDAPYYGAYTVEVFNGSCYALSDPVVMTGGIAGLSETNSNFTILPNPAQNAISLSGSLAATAAKFVLKDLQGKQVLMQYSNGMDAQILHVESIPQGTYFIDVLGQREEVLFRKRVVISH